ncbi:ribonuclease H-like domain-containing protein [Tanacetum coccineum]
MSPPIRRKYHNSVAFATGCKKIKKCRRGNRKIRIPIAMWSCRVEEKMTLKEVDRQTVEEIETKINAKDGTITRVPGQFQGYETSEEEPVGQPRRHDLLCFNCQRPGHFAKDCRVPSRQVAPMNAVRMSNNLRVCYECGSPDHFRNTCPKMNRVPRQAGNQLDLEGSDNNQSNGNQVSDGHYNVNVNAMEAVQDPNVVTGTFSLNDHFVTVLFDSGADFSFISTEFAPLLNVKPSIVNPGYVIEVADGMDWLSQHKAVIVCHEKVVEIPVEDGRILRVHGERTVGIVKAAILFSLGLTSGIRAYEIPPPPSSQTPTQQTPHTVSTIKLSILKRGEYDIWAMKMEHYLAHTDYPIWEVIQNRNGPVSITTDTQGQIKVLPPRTAEEILARERERKARTTLLMALPEDHLAKFHKMTDAKEMWEAIKSRFGGNDESKKMQKFQSLLSQLEIHGAGVSTEDANQKFLRSLPSAWSQVSLIMRTKPGDGTSLNVAFVSETPADLEQLDEFDLEEMDLKWQVAMISMRMKKFYKKTGRKLQFDAKEPVGFDKTKVECYNCHKTRYFARECKTKGNQDNRRRDAWKSGNKDGRRSGKQEDSKALVTIDGEGVDWTSHSEEEEDYALMACNSSGSDTEVTSCSNECKESYAKLKKLYDAQREQLSDASIEIKAYTQGLKKVEAQLVAHQQEAEKEKGDLKAKVQKWHNSSKNLGKLLNTQMSANDKFRPGGMHVVPHHMTGNYMPSGPDVEVYYSQFTYGPKQSQTSEPETQTSDFDTCESDCSVETNEPLPEPTVNKPKVVCQPKVWSDAPIIEEYESDSEDEHVSQSTEEQDTPIDKKGLGYGFTTKACFVCGSLSHLIRDCDFHEKRMAKQAELNNKMSKKSSQREIRPTLDPYVNTAEVNTVSAVGGKKETAVKPSAGCNWRPKGHYWHKISKYNSGSRPRNYATIKDPLGRLKPKQVESLRETKSNFIQWHMTGINRPLADSSRRIMCPCCFWKEVKILTRRTKCLFTDFECLVLSPEFKFHYSMQVLLESTRKKQYVQVSISEIIIPSGGLAWIKREYSNARTPQQNRVTERKNMTLIDAARTMLVDSFLPNTFWAEAGKGPTWLFDLDYLTNLMHYQPVRSENQANKPTGPQEANHNAGTQDNINAGESDKEDESAQDYFVPPIWSSYSSTIKRSTAKDAGEVPDKHPDLKIDEKPVDKEDQVFLDELKRLKKQENEANDAAEALRMEFAQETENLLIQTGAAKASSTNIVNTVSTPVNTASPY